MIFEKGEIEGLRSKDMKTFVNHRLNLCLANLGIQPVFNEEHNPIKEWFYKGINNVQFHDFFSGIGSEYNRDWDENGFVW